MSEQTPAPEGDWGFPPVEPAADPLLGWTPEPALPAAGVAVEPNPAPPYDPPVSTPDWSIGAGPAEVPPSTGVMPVPRRHPAAGGSISPLRALAGAAVAVAGVLLGIGALLWATDGPKGSPALQQTQAQSSQLTSLAPSPSTSPAPQPAIAPPAPVVTRPAPSPAAVAAAAPKLALTVLNNSTRTGLAKRAAARYAAAGWPIKLTGSFRGRITETTAYFAPGQQASALALQKAFPAIARVRPRFAGLPGSGLTVVLTRTYPA